MVLVERFCLGNASVKMQLASTRLHREGQIRYSCAEDFPCFAIFNPLRIVYLLYYVAPESRDVYRYKEKSISALRFRLLQVFPPATAPWSTFHPTIGGCSPLLQ
mmetsp:Transcript_25095/g.54745  ORF Transcript_25095/g.54745 Transcript_25095/m.54745 type:complete len:104 (+) Transcript_25095:1289-1600(+)